MTQSNNDIEELEELLTELEGQEAQLVRPYAEDDDAVTQLMDAPLGDQEWMVQVTALDRRMMSTDQVLAELRAGKLSNRTLVWRGGMDDWLPISRVESLSGASAGGVSHGGMPVAAPGRLAAPAPLPAPPMWATLPSAAPLPPPPTALPPVVSSAPMTGPVGLPPAAAAPLPPPPSEPSSPRPVSLPPPPPAMMSTSSNTARPVAIDFSELSEDTTSPLRGKRAILALSAVAVLAVFVSVYALSSKSDGTATAAPSSAEQPRSVAALQPAAEKKTEPPAAAEPAPKPAEPAAAPASAPKPAESELAANDSSASSSARTTAPARYSPRSEYRRRSRGAAERQDDSEASEASDAPAPRSPAPRAAVAARASAEDEAPASEPAAAPSSGGASDDADATEAPKSTGGKSNTFNREAAKAALAEAAAQAKNCRPAGGPSGTGRVQVHYEPTGKVSKVDILTGKFENTTTGSCVVMLFRRAKVPEFTGAPVVTVSKSFEIP
jgi:hypothetical protein